MSRFITSADTVITMTASTIFPAPVTFKDFAVEDIFGTDEVQRSEVQMGASGTLVAGYVPQAKTFTVSFLATSETIDIMETLQGAQEVAKAVYRLDGTVRIPATGKSYTLTNGYLVSSKSMPDAKKTLQAQSYKFTFESIMPSLL